MATNVIRQDSGDMWQAYQGDCVDVMTGLPDDSIGLSVFSPPFADLYAYSDSDRDMGNSRNYEEFFRAFSFMVEGIMRVMCPGRIVAVHCIDIPAMKERDGYIGLKDFPGDIIRCFQRAGFIYHSRHVIWKDPLIEATRTKAIGLMHKQLCKDSALSRAGLPDYLLAFRKPGDNELPIAHADGLTEYHGANDPGGSGVKRSHNIWRAYASPIWTDIRQSNTLNAQDARDNNDQKHICPLQLDVIYRVIELWSAPNDVVLSPFAGIGSEGYAAVMAGRRAVLIEMKDTYYNLLCKNLIYAEEQHTQQYLF